MEEIEKAKKSAKTRGPPGKKKIPVGNYRLRWAERWEQIATVASEVGEI